MILFLSLELLALPQTDHSLRRKANSILEKALQDSNPNTRRQAVIALSLTASRQPFLSQLESMLADKDVQVRIATIASLVDLRDRNISPALRGVLNDHVPEMSFAAAKALLSFTTQPVSRRSCLF